MGGRECGMGDRVCGREIGMVCGKGGRECGRVCGRVCGRACGRVCGMGGMGGRECVRGGMECGMGGKGGGKRIADPIIPKVFRGGEMKLHGQEIKIGDKVWDLSLGWGKVGRIDKESAFLPMSEYRGILRQKHDELSQTRFKVISNKFLLKKEN